MFVRHLESVRAPAKPGSILALNKVQKSYFLINCSYIERMLSKMLQCVGTSGNDGVRIFSKFKDMARYSAMQDWEFYYSGDPKAALPTDVVFNFKHIPSESLLESTHAKEGRCVYKVEHKFTNMPVYVVDKSVTTKAGIMRKAFVQLEKYHTQSHASFSSTVAPHLHEVGQMLDVYDKTICRINYDPRDVTFEPVKDSDSFATHANHAHELNTQALSEWVSKAKSL